MYLLRFFNTFVIVTLFLLLYQNYFEDDFYDNVLTNYKSLISILPKRMYVIRNRFFI